MEIVSNNKNKMFNWVNLNQVRSSILFNTNCSFVASVYFQKYLASIYIILFSKCVGMSRGYISIVLLLTSLFNCNVEHDIVLFKMHKPVICKFYILSICLQQSEHLPTRTAIASEWGMTSVLSNVILDYFPISSF